MTSKNFLSRVNFNFKLYKHCKEISILYKKNTFQKCLEILSTNKYTNTLNIPAEISATYLSKRIRLINGFLGVDNCLANSMSLYLAISNRQNVSFIVGISKEFLEDSFSHCWVEIKKIAINEEDSIMNYKSLINIHK